MTDKNRFTLWYYDQDEDSDEDVLIGIEALVPNETLTAMLTGNAHFYRFIIGDGEKFIIAANRVHSIKQII